MNEKLIKQLIKYKLKSVRAVVDYMPSKFSREIKDLGKVILEGINESPQEMKEQPSQGPSGKLDNIPIE